MGGGGKEEEQKSEAGLSPIFLFDHSDLPERRLKRERESIRGNTVVQYNRLFVNFGPICPNMVI